MIEVGFNEKEKNISLELDSEKLNNSFDDLEITSYLYLYDKKTTAENILFSPYEEYSKEVTVGKRTTYSEISNFGNKVFGVLVGLIIFLIFFIFKRSEIFSIESTVSILGAYAIGKEMWTDVDSFLSTLTKNRPIRWLPQNYFFKKENFGTVQRFWNYARQQRNKSTTILADKFDFITHSNSKTLELYFKKKELNKGNPLFLKISLDDVDDFKKKNFMLGFKVAKIKRRIFLNISTETFQAISIGKIGTMDRKKWVENKSFVRRTLSIGRLKFYLSSKLVSKNILKIR